MAEWKELGNKAKNLTLAGLGKARDLGQSAKLNLDNVSEEENRKRIYVEIGKRFVSEHATGFSTVNRSCAAALKESDGRRNSCPCSSWCPDC